MHNDDVQRGFEDLRRILGIGNQDIEAEKKAAEQQFVNYCQLLKTMTPKEFAEEVGVVFGDVGDMRRVAIIVMLAAHIFQLQGKDLNK